MEKAFLKEHGVCAACGGTTRLQVHHIIPFHLAPELELEESNLITLCMAKGKYCHFYLGHGRHFKAYNPHVRNDVSILKAVERGFVGYCLKFTAYKEAKRTRKTAL